MGTRADFYIGKGEGAIWLGSIAWDGYPEGDPRPLDEAVDQASYTQAVKIAMESCMGYTTPEMGWPWPWEDSRTTDYAYTWDESEVWISNFGSPWISWSDYHSLPEGDDGRAFEEYCKDKSRPEFPNMKDKQNVRFDSGSGILLVER